MSTVILIAGPTASGKSALALALAEKLGGEVVNADSMQVYRDLRIITARPTPDEEQRVPHRLYGHVDAAENYSVGRWCADAAAALAAAQAAGRPAIVIGGTGLYFNALTRGIAAVPPIPAEIREEVRAPAGQRRRAGAACRACRRAIRRARRGCGPATARASRARSKWCWRPAARCTTGTTTTSRRRSISRGVAKVFLMPDRDELLKRIDARFDAMMAAGALDEVRALAARDLDPSLPAMKAHGVPWLIRHLKGEIALAEAIEGGKRDTRQYTKRQATWFRNQLAAI